MLVRLCGGGTLRAIKVNIGGGGIGEKPLAMLGCGMRRGWKFPIGCMNDGMNGANDTGRGGGGGGGSGGVERVERCGAGVNMTASDSSLRDW